MLTTIEEKLSAIKAINEEKDKVERGIAALVRFTDNATDVSIEIRTSKESLGCDMPPQAVQNVLLIIAEQYSARRGELISKATELMK